MHGDVRTRQIHGVRAVALAIKRKHEREHVPDFHRTCIVLAPDTAAGRANAHWRWPWFPFLNQWRVIGLAHEMAAAGAA
jgi:hypothetical protein